MTGKPTLNPDDEAPNYKWLVMFHNRRRVVVFTPYNDKALSKQWLAYRLGGTGYSIIRIT